MKRPPPPDLWDLHGQNTLHIDKTRTSLTCEHLITTITTDTKTTEVTIWAIRCRGYSPNAPSFTIAVTDPETAVQALRQSSTWGPNESDIIQQLVSQGYPFHTLYPRPRDRKRGEWSTRSSGSLGFRPPDFKPTPTDYAKYEATRERILTPSITRAALKRGGIIWRLTLEIFESLADAVDVILNPSEASLPCWNGLKIKTRSEGEYVDDLLDREAEYIICGVYDVYVQTNDDTTAEKSWWPKQSAWDSSGLNLGYWTPDCEDWYQHRLSQIRADKAELRSATQWQKSMNQQKKSRQVRQSNRECASKFLEG
ncbi:hypothetical protein BDN72DRAFT_762135 [Pluteus cervinus]|uniref:Uncharacterized protein n=1 Tax=Pluteus cervinus TaxID=181527 RepID=A0ACD3B4R3_9AGAR|nr:hypothetical protein BDN72DRAFT_762135 [Pluteus cervinus]